MSLSYLRLLEECGRRGGPRWIEFLAEREEELVRNLEDPAQRGVWLALQSALRRSRGEGLPLRVVVHPDDLETAPRGPSIPIRFALQNVDPVHSYDLAFIRADALASVQSPAGRDAPRKRFPNLPHVGLARHARVAPGETTTTHDAEGWWTVDVSDEFDFGEGDWTVRLLYLPLGGGQFSHFESGATAFASEPFVVRIRKQQ